MGKIKAHMMTPTTPPFKHNMLRRRMDDNDGMVRFIFYFVLGAVDLVTSLQYFPLILPFQNQLECGVPRTAQNTIQKRIIGGRIAPFAALPWQAHIRIAEYQCGGVLGK